MVEISDSSTQGSLVVEPVDVDGSLTGIPGAYLDRVVVLEWSE